jgi:16S rRNA (uracil1498-N3)-methyltransferase
MHRFYLPPEQCRDSTLVLADREAHHARQVLRVRPGEQVTVLDGAGAELVCEVRDFERDNVCLRVIQRREAPPSPFRVTLLQAVPKGKTFESILQKATELGVARVVPLLSERAAVRLDPPEATRKARKWQWVAIDAIKQCGSAWLPEIQRPVTPAVYLARKEDVELSLIASLQPGSRHAREYFRDFQARQGRKPESVCVWVGPEGDFSSAESAQIQAAGARPITLGRLVLRAETAAVYCLSVLNYELESTA